MKDFRKVQEKIQKFSIRKLSVGVGSVAIAALIFGSFLTSPAVAADEVGKTGQAHYTYVEEQELTEQEKELIKHELPSDLQSGENYYLIYRKQGKPTVLPQTGNNGQPLLGMLAGTAILAVLVFSRKKAGKLVGVLLIGAFGQSLLLSPQVFALENKELVSYNRQVPISSGVSEADLAIEGYDYIGYFTASDLRALTGTSPASLTEEISLKDQLAVPENSKSGRDARGQEKQTELMEEEKPDQDISSQAGSISDSTPNPSSQGLHPNKETSKEENKTNPNQSEKSSSSKGEPEVQPEKPTYTEPVGTAGDTAPVEPALPAYTGSVNGDPEVQPEKPAYTGPVGTAGDTAPVEPALPAYTGSVNGEPEVQPEKPAYTGPVGTAGDTAPVEPALPEYTGSVNGEPEVQPEKLAYTGPVGTSGDIAPVEPALPEYTGGVNGESTVQAELPSLHTEVKLETIEPKVVHKTDDSKYLDEETTVEGTPGQKEIVTSYEVLDGKRISEPQTTERTLHEAVDTVVTRGTKTRVNKEELSKQLALAAAVDPAVYTNQSYQQLQAIKNMAESVYQTSSSQDEVDAGVNQLKQALADLLALKTAPTLTVSAVKKDELQKSAQIQYQLTDRDQAFTSAHVRLKKDGQLIAEQNLATGQLTASFSGLDYYTPYDIETTLSYDLGNGSESQELDRETVQLDLKKVELKSITNVALMKVENGQTKLMPTLAEKPANLDQYYLHFTSDQFKDTVLPVTSIEEVVVDNQPVFKIKAQLPDLLQRSATGLQNSFDFYLEKAKKREGNVYYDFQDLLDGIKENPSGTFILGRSISAKLIDKPANSKSYLPGEFKGQLIGGQNGERHAILDLAHPLFDTITGGTVKDIDFKRVNMVYPDSQAGDTIATIAARLKNKGVIENVNVQGYLEGRDHIAGLVNNIEGQSRVENVSFKGRIKSKGGNSVTAGIAGTNAMSLVKRAYVEADIWVKSGQNAGMLVAQNFTDYSGSGWGNWGRLMQSVAKGKLEDAGSRNAAGIAASIWPYGTINDTVSYATVVNGKELFSSDNEITDAWMGQKLQNLFGVQGHSSGTKIGKDAKFRRLTEAEAEQKVKSYRITALEETSANEVTTEKLNAAILRTSTYQDKPGYKAENEQLYQNLERFMPFYNQEFLIHEANKLVDAGKAGDLLTKKVLSVQALKGNQFVAGGTDADKILVHFADGSKTIYNLQNQARFEQTVLPEYQIAELGTVYTPNHSTAVKEDLLTQLTESLKSFDLYSDEVYRSVGLPNDNDRVNKVKRLFLDESLTEVKANLQDMISKLLANEWTRFHADNPAANEALKAKIEENKTAIMLGLTYLNRYYDLKFGDYNLKELVLFKPDFYGEKVPLLDRLIKIGRSTENQLKGADNVNMFARQLKAESKSSDLVAYLDYNRRLLTDFADMDSWFKDATRGFIQFEERQSEVEEIKSAKYRVFDNLNSEYFSNYILPLLTLKNTRLAILSNYSTMAFVNRDKRRSWSDERFNARIKEVATQHRNHVDTWYKLLSDDIKSRMVKQNVTAVWDGFDVEGRGWIDVNGNDNKGKPYAPSREFFNLVGGRAGGWYKSNGYGAHAAGSIRVNFEAFDLLTEYGVSVFTHELTHVNDGYIYLGGHGRRQGIGPEGYAQGMLQSPVPDQPGWGALGLNMAFDRPNDGSLIFNSSPSLFKNRADIDHYMKGYNDTLMLLDYLEGQAVVDKGNAAAAKWFKKVEPKVVDARTQYDVVRELTAEEKAAMSVSSVNDLVDQGLISNRAVDNRTYNPADYDSSYIAIDFMTGIYGGGQNNTGAPGALMFKHNTFRIWGYYGYEKGFVSYASNKHRKTANEQGVTGLSDNFIIKQISGGEFETMEAFKKAYFRKVVDKAQSSGIKPVTVNGKVYRSYEELKAGFAEAVDKDLKKSRVDERATKDFKYAVFTQLLKNTNSFMDENSIWGS